MMTRRELLLGGAAAFAAAPVGRPAWAATPAASSSAVAPAVTAAAGSSPFDAIIGESPAVVAFRDSLRALLDRMAGLPRPPLVLLLGETGAGKDLAAQVIHAAGPRSNGPFLNIHVPAIPGETTDGELWGWAKGASTHPTEKSGVWEDAHGGTLYLDQIGELGAGMLRKVRRVVETGSVRRLGDTQPRETDAWTIASCHDPYALIEKQMVEKLRAHLKPIIIRVPPLRVRRDDIQLLADHFLAEACRACDKPLMVLTPAARDTLAEYVWPGNVRELGNMMEAAVFLCEDREISAESLPIDPRRDSAWRAERRRRAKRRAASVARPAGRFQR